MQTAEYLATYLDHPSPPQLANEEGWILVTTHCQIANKIKNNLRKTSSRNVTEFFLSHLTQNRSHGRCSSQLISLCMV